MAWDILSTEVLAKTPRFDLVKEQVRLPNGNIKDIYLIEQNDSAVIMPVTADGKILLILEYRHPCRGKVLSLPGGLVETGDTPLKTAEKELFEETGYKAESFELVQAVYQDPPRTNRLAHLFIAHNAILIAKQDLTEFEDLEVVLMTPQELLQALAQGQVDSLPDIGLMYLGLHRLGFIK
jgi:ADP-ribose pyrophosphatase